jgi:hypothetical protein
MHEIKNSLKIKIYCEKGDGDGTKTPIFNRGVVR